eukprot:scaffold79891_cov63-Phaeocystis_antarctica.AAC.3
MQRAATHCGGRKHHRRAEAAAVVGAAIEGATRERDVCAARVGAGGGADRKDDQPRVMPTVGAGNVRRGKVGEDGGLRVGRELLAVGAHRDLEVAVRRADRAVRPCDRRRQLGRRERLLHGGRHRVGGEALHGGRAAIDEAAAARRAAPRPQQIGVCGHIRGIHDDTAPRHGPHLAQVTQDSVGLAREAAAVVRARLDAARRHGEKRRAVLGASDGTQASHGQLLTPRGPRAVTGCAREDERRAVRGVLLPVERHLDGRGVRRGAARRPAEQCARVEHLRGDGGRHRAAKAAACVRRRARGVERA